MQLPFCSSALFCLFVSLVLCDSSPCGATQIKGLSIGHNVTYFGNLANAPVFYPLQPDDDDDDDCDYFNSFVSYPTAWFTFTPTVNSIVTATTCGLNTNFDTVLGLYGGDCADLYCIYTNDDYGRCENINDSLLQFLSSGEQIYIGLTGYSDHSGNYEITFSEEIGPDSSCISAQPLMGPFSTPLAIVESTENGTQSLVSSCGLPTGTNQVWYTLQTDSAVPLTITTCNDNTNFDTIISLFAGNCTYLECMYYNDDNCTLSNVGGASSLYFTPIPNSLYYLVVSGVDGANGTFSLDIFEDGFAQDGCTDAFIVDLDRTQTFQGSTIGGSLLRSPATCNIEQGYSMWYSIFTPTGKKSITFSICNTYTNFDAYMSIYSDSCTEPMCITSSMGGCTTSGGELTFNLNANEYAYLVVASADGSAGYFEIDVTFQ